MDLGAIWHLCFWGLVTHCVRWGFLVTQGKWRVGSSQSMES